MKIQSAFSGPNLRFFLSAEFLAYFGEPEFHGYFYWLKLHQVSSQSQNFLPYQSNNLNVHQ
jgi:hypothetical protein